MDRHFMENIRAYNSMFAMTSLGAQLDDYTVHIKNLGADLSLDRWPWLCIK